MLFKCIYVYLFCLVSDDGINNWVHTQWAMDHHIPLIVVNHLTSEAAGIKKLSEYLSEQFLILNFIISKMIMEFII